MKVDVGQDKLNVTLTYRCRSLAEASEIAAAMKELYERLGSHSTQCLIQMAQGVPCRCKDKLVGPKMEQLLRPKVQVSNSGLVELMRSELKVN